MWYVRIDVGGKNHQLQIICVVTASYTLSFFMPKSPGLLFQMKHIFENKYFLMFSFKEKMFVIQFHSKEKNANHNISKYGKMLIMILSRFFFGLWNSMITIYFHNMKQYDKHFLSNRASIHRLLSTYFQ